MKGNDAKSPRIQGATNVLLNLGIIVLTATALFFVYSLVNRTAVRPPVDPTKVEEGDVRVIQIDVLNGCGIPGVAGRFTNFLRSRGYDVVEVGNYRTFDLPETLVIDRIGNIENAQKVAYALGIKESNVIQQINPDYFLDATVVIGLDYENLRPMR